MYLHEEEILQTISDLKGQGKTIAEFLATLLKGKLVEIYLGDAYEEVSTEQISTSYPAVFCGKVIGAYRECLILNGAYVDRITKKMRTEHIMFISERAIRVLNPIDGRGVFEDSFLRSRESLEVKKIFDEKDEKIKKFLGDE